MRTRVVGTETEFGIVTRDAGSSDPVNQSILLVGSCPVLPSPDILWDYENENPLNDARGFEIEGEKERPGPEYNRLLNKLLFNGGRLYVDGAHPEYSSPECVSPRELVAYEKAGERILDRCRETCDRISRKENGTLLYKNNTDGKSNSYGYHENYLVERGISFDALARQLIPFLITRQVYTGAGKVGGENRSEPVDYQISQRADFFEALIDLNTMVKRPIMNTRDEPHAEASKYRRLHVIVGDSNMSETSTFLKIGTMMLVLSAIEEGVDFGVSVENPVKVHKAISRDLTLKKKYRLVGGGEMTALEIQKVYLEKTASIFENGKDSPPFAKEVLEKWKSVLSGLESDPDQLSTELDWLIKRQMIASYVSKKGYGWTDPKIFMMDLQYHDISPEKGLYHHLEKDGFVKRMITDGEINHAMENPPAGTRAYFRGNCLRKFPKEIYAASWTSVLFDVGEENVKRIPLMDPFRGNRELVEKIFESSYSVKDLLNNLVRSA